MYLLEFEEYLQLNEIGDLKNLPYPWEFWGKQGTTYKYNFKTDSGLKYVVFFDQWDPKTWEVMFKVEGKSAKDLTGEGKMMTVLATVMPIMKDFIEQNKKCKVITLTGENKKGEKGKEATARTRIYFKVIEKNLSLLSPKATARLKDNLIYITLG